MISPKPTRSRLVAIGSAVLLGVVVAGCGSAAQDGAATQTASPEAAGSTSEAGVDSASPVPTSETSMEDVAANELDSAAERLADVSSYRFSIRFSGQAGTAESQSTLAMEGTVVTRPERAIEFSMLNDADGGSSALRYVVIGDEAWMDLGDGGVMSFTAEEADALFEAYSPQSLFGQSYVGFIDGMNAVGDEEKNGVATTHYAADESTLGAVAALYGGTGASWNMDVWVAREGAYLVSAVMGGEVSGAAGGSYEVAIDVFDIDSPSNVVTAPSS